jgi:hypothetical protein
MPTKKKQKYKKRISKGTGQKTQSYSLPLRALEL